VTQIIRLLIADDHPVVRDGLRGIFEASGEFEVAGEAANGREAVDRAAALRPDVVLMDLRMPVLDGVSAIRLLAEKGVSARVLVLTIFDTDTDAVPAIEAGATGYLLKDCGCGGFLFRFPLPVPSGPGWSCPAPASAAALAFAALRAAASRSRQRRTGPACSGAAGRPPRTPRPAEAATRWS